jgi:oligopeptide transport system permease protein
MLRFLVSRILQGFVVIITVLIITFVLMKAAPGGPFDRERAVPEFVKANLEEQYGLNKPWPVQLWNHVKNFLTGNWPMSYRFKGRSVAEIISNGFPPSATVGIAALLIAIGIGVPAGAFAAVRPDKWEDRAAMIGATVGISMPSLVLGPVLLLLFALKLRWFSVGGWHETEDWVLPAMTLGIIYAAYIARITRGGLRETLAQEFIRTARAKGASEGAVLWKHAAKLSCLPLLNFLAPAAAGLLTGSFITENVFQIPGLGQHFVASAVNKDFTLASATAAFYAVLIVGFNLIVDVLQAWLNPRIGFKE